MILAAKLSLGEATTFKRLKQRRPIDFLFHPAKLASTDYGINMGFGVWLRFVQGMAHVININCFRDLVDLDISIARHFEMNDCQLIVDLIGRIHGRGRIVGVLKSDLCL